MTAPVTQLLAPVQTFPAPCLGSGPWVIQADDPEDLTEDDALYWNGEWGWVGDVGDATRFEHAPAVLGLGGENPRVILA